MTASAAEDGGVVTVRHAGPGDLDVLLPLFLGYLDFYEVPPAAEPAEAYLRGHLERSSSTVLLAVTADGRVVGFAQLYPTWESLSLSARFILYDLFVAPDHRRRGVGRQLVDASSEVARSSGASVLSLDTARANLPAQALYEALGFARDEDFVTYHRELD